MPTCRFCRREIKWARTENGKAIPLDPHPHADGNVELINGVARVVGKSDDPADIRHMPHHATCPSPFNPANRKKKKP